MGILGSGCATYFLNMREGVNGRSENIQKSIQLGDLAMSMSPPLVDPTQKETQLSSSANQFIRSAADHHKRCRRHRAAWDRLVPNH